MRTNYPAWSIAKPYIKHSAPLPDKQRKVLLFDFWGALPDGEIAKRMEVTTRTVYNLRQRAFQAIRTFYEQESSEP
ncbi:MAG: RNA polymerase sigma factor [Oscillospiraceae bacterium]